MHSRLTTMTAAAALIAGFGVAASPVWADPYADDADLTLPDPTGSSVDVSADDGDNGEDALGEPDHVSHGGAVDNNTAWTSVGYNDSTDEGGVLVLDFLDNVCFNAAGADLTVYEVGHGETYDVAVGLQGDPLTLVGDDVTGDAAVEAGAIFNQVSITSEDATGNVNLAGADIDAVECASTLDVADIEKDFEPNPLDVVDPGTGVDDEIFAGIDDLQYKAFTISITNNTGIDEAFAGLYFRDTVPAEWDASPDSEDAAEGTPNDTVCADGDPCDGIEVTSEPEAGDCTASIVEHQSNGNGNKLKPDFITITADGLADTESCLITVWVQTDDDHPGRGRSPDATPTSCPVTLNDGVEVEDSSGNTLLEDDDSLVFVDKDPADLEDGEGICTPL